MGTKPATFSTAEWADLLGIPPPVAWPSDVNGVQSDSRRVRPGDLFVAINGNVTDGHRFISDAVTRGASGVVIEESLTRSYPVPTVQVSSARIVLATLSRVLAGHPDQKLHLIGVTGTNGKTSVTRHTRHLLEANGLSAASLGTVGVTFAGREIPARRTTPAGPDLHQILADAVRAQCTHAVMEVSSHGLDQHRVHGLEFDTVVFTNLSQDHLDYHSDMEAYFEAKATLFAMPGVRNRIVGEDDWSGKLAGRFGPDVLRCGLGEECDVRAVVQESNLSGVIASLTSPWGKGTIRSPLPGIHNLRNTLQSVAVAACAGLEFSGILEAVETLQAAPGRLEPIPCPVGKVYVDYAHTPDALVNVLQLVKGLTPGKVRVVFGCGGDRDRSKRPLMVQAAAAHADELILTMDNPRTEDPEQIFTDMKEGLTSEMSVQIEPDRTEAIRLGLTGLEDGDTLVIAGKGHETVQEIGSIQRPFDDRLVARRILEEQSPLKSESA